MARPVYGAAPRSRREALATDRQPTSLGRAGHARLLGRRDLWLRPDAFIWRSTGLPGRNRPAACPLLFDEWFHRDDFEACSFINVLLEMGRAHPAGEESVEHLANIRAVVRRLAEEAALRDPDSFAHAWHILMKGSIVSATEGDAEAAQRARSMANLLIERHR